MTFTQLSILTLGIILGLIFGVGTIPRYSYMLVWKRYIEERESKDYVPGFRWGDFGLAVLFPFTFLCRDSLESYYMFLDDGKILKYESYQQLWRKVHLVGKAMMAVVSVPMFIFSVVLMTTLFLGAALMRELNQLSREEVCNRLGPVPEKEDITPEKIRQKLKRS